MYGNFDTTTLNNVDNLFNFNNTPRIFLIESDWKITNHCKIFDGTFLSSRVDGTENILLINYIVGRFVLNKVTHTYLYENNIFQNSIVPSPDIKYFSSVN